MLTSCHPPGIGAQAEPTQVWLERLWVQYVTLELPTLLVHVDDSVVAALHRTLGHCIQPHPSRQPAPDMATAWALPVWITTTCAEDAAAMTAVAVGALLVGFRIVRRHEGAL
jgi:hypothetical protein